MSKYPSQDGTVVSTNAIIKNRVVKLRGMISNVQLKNSDELRKYSEDEDTKNVHESMRQLVNRSVLCKVTTNLGAYENVIFTSYETETKEGLVDAMDFTIMGEELQIPPETFSNRGSTNLRFSEVLGASRDAVVASFATANIDVGDTDSIFESAMDFAKGGITTATNALGDISESIYEAVGGSISVPDNVLRLETNDLLAYPPEFDDFLESDFADPSILDGVDLLGGLQTGWACTKKQGSQLAVSKAEDFIDTEYGKLTKTAFGAAYEIFGVNGETSTAQELLKLGSECLVASVGGATGTTCPEDFDDDHSFFSTDKLLNGIKSKGSLLATGLVDTSSLGSLYKIQAGG